MALLSSVIQSGTRAAQPAASAVAAGVLYFVTDEGVLERSTGAAWVEVAINETAHDSLDHTGLTGVGGGGAASFIGVKAYNNAVQSIPDSTNTPLTFNSEDYDSDALHDTGSNTSRITVNQTGVWRFTYGTNWATTSATGIRVVFLRIDGTTNVEGSDMRVPGSTAINVFTGRTVDVELTSGQYVEVVAFQNRGGALDAGYAHGGNPGLVSVFSAQFLGAP